MHSGTTLSWRSRVQLGSISCSKRKLTSWGWFKWNWPEQIARCKSKKWTAKIEDQFVRHKEFPHCKQINSDCWIYSTQSASNVRLQHIPTKPSTSQRQDTFELCLNHDFLLEKGWTMVKWIWNPNYKERELEVANLWNLPFNIYRKGKF